MDNQLQLYTKNNLIKIIEKANTSTAIALFNNENRVNLRTLTNTAPEETIKLLSIILLRLFADMNVEKNLSAEWFQELAGMIAERFIILSIEDIIKCFRNIKAGEYGKNYNNFTMAYIIDCISVYEDNLIREIDLQHEKQKKDINQGRSIESVRKIYEKLKRGESVEPVGDESEREKNKAARLWYINQNSINNNKK
jgi:hypothetical protein